MAITGPSGQQPASKPSEPTGIRMDSSFAGKDYTVFSLTGEKQTEATFNRVMSDFAKGKPIPGFTVFEEGTGGHKLLSAYEGVNQPVQAAAVAMDRGVAPLSGLLPPGLQQAISPAPVGAPPSTATQGFPLAQTVAEQVNTLPKAGMTLGMAGMAKLNSPVSTIMQAGNAVKTTLSKGNILWNMAKTGAGGMVGAELGRMATGQGNFDPVRSGIEFAAAAGVGGFNGMLTHFGNKIMGPKLYEEVVGGILGEIRKKYPHILTEGPERAIQIYTSSADGLRMATQQMSKGLRGGLDNTASEISDTITSMLPTALSKGDKISFAANVKRFVNAGNKMLDDVGDDDAFANGAKGVAKAADDLATFVVDRFASGKNKMTPATEAKIRAYIQAQQASLDTFQEGALVLHYLKQSGADEGFNINRFGDAIRGKADKSPGSLLQKVGRQLGYGHREGLGGASAGPTSTEQAGLKVGSAALGMIPGGNKAQAAIQLGSMLRGRNTPPPVNILPWQRQGGTLPGAIGAQATGNAAIRSFVGEPTQVE